MFEYSGLSTTDSAIGVAGNIVGVAGFENVNIGETLGGSADTEPLPFVAIDPPTISMEFSINNGPFGGRDGKNVTSRVIRDRLMREMRTNISIQVRIRTRPAFSPFPPAAPCRSPCWWRLCAVKIMNCAFPVPP